MFADRVCPLDPYIHFLSENFVVMKAKLTAENFTVFSLFLSCSFCYLGHIISLVLFHKRINSTIFVL
jgi:hypothetical protein